MATSSKVKFNLETLKVKALESIDERISWAKRQVDSFEDPSVLEERVRQWRADQEKRVSDLFRRLGEGDGSLSNNQLEMFRIHSMPEDSDHERRRAENDLRRLETIKSKIIAKTDSLVPDEDGGIALTKTQLDEFFGL